MALAPVEARDVLAVEVGLALVEGVARPRVEAEPEDLFLLDVLGPLKVTSRTIRFSFTTKRRTMPPEPSGCSVRISSKNS
jgi:hypothetical protein